MGRSISRGGDIGAEAIAYYLRYPDRFVEDMVLGLSPEQLRANKPYGRLEPESRAILQAYAEHRLVSVVSGRGVTKCVDVDEELLVGDGRYVRAGDLVGSSFDMLSMVELWGETVRAQAYADDNGIQECVRIRTQYGADIIRTLNHPLLAFEGWKPCSELRVGEKIAMPGKMDLGLDGFMSADELKFLAYIIGDGCCSQRFITFTQEDNAVLDEMRGVAENIGCVLKKVKSNKYDYRVASLRRYGRNPGIALLEKHGLMLKTSFFKKIPDALYKLRKDDVRLFLSRLMATDGYAHSPNGRSESLNIGFTTVSRQLAVGVKRLMLRFGIVGIVSESKTAWTYKGIKKYGTTWQWSIHDCHNVMRFCDKIGIYGKEKAVERCRVEAQKRLNTPNRNTTGCRALPIESLQYILDSCEANNITRAQLRNVVGVRKRAPRHGVRVTEHTVKKYLQHYKDEKLKGMIDNEIKWDTVKSLEYVGKRKTVAIFVPEYGNYISDVYEHNTFTLAMIVLHFLFTRHNAKVICTGPKFDQLKITLWAEINKWLQKAPGLNDQLVWTSEKVYHVSSPGTWFATIVTANEPENMQGIRDEHVMFIIDEASGVADAIFKVIFGGLTLADNRLIIAGNPTKTSGFHHDSYTGDKQMWKVLQFNSEKCALVTKEWLAWMRSKYTPDSDMYRVHVLGLPPKGNPKAVISLEDCIAARDRDVDENADFLEMGVDPARQGDDLTAIAIRRGYKLLEVRVHAKKKAYETVTLVIMMLREYRQKTGIKSKCRIKVDETGYGGGITDYLTLKAEENIEVVPVNFAKAGNEEYADYPTIMWFNMAAMMPLVSLPNDDLLIGELSTREWNTPAGKVKVEPKDVYKSREGDSPDRADACIMCFAEGQRKVFARDNYDEKTVRAFDVDWNCTRMFDSTYDGPIIPESRHYVAITLAENLMLFALHGVYEIYSDKLWLYNEYLQTEPYPETFSKAVKYYGMVGKFEDNRNPRIVGNQLMFKAREQANKRSMAEIFKRECNLNIRECLNYDPYGAIGMGAMMFKNNSIIIHKDLTDSQLNINLWQIKNESIEDKSYWICQSFLMILSEVRNQKKNIPAKPKMHDYKPVVTKTDKKNNANAWMKR